jgi:hypothetical protein
MIKYFFLILALLIHTSFSFCQSSSCADSVKTTYYYHADDNSTEYSVTDDTFDLDSGKVVSCVRSGDSPATMGSLGCTQGYWSKNILSYNLNGDSAEVLTKTGSAAGWKDSVRTVYTYDANSGKMLTKSGQMWNGTSWIQTQLYSWTYNTSNLLTEEMDQYLLAGNIANRSRIIYTYTGNNLNVKIIQKGSGNTWVNDKSYIFSYDVSGIRDSVNYRIWDTLSFTWNNIGNSPYYINNLKLADFSITKIVNVGGNLYTDSTYFSIDTLENIIYFYELTPTGHQSMGDFYNMTIRNFTYVNNKYVKTHSYNADYWIDNSFPGLNWYCTGDDQDLYYDAQSYLIKSTQGARCVMPNDFTTEYNYNTNHILVKQTGHLDSNSRVNDYTYNFFYGNADSVIVFEDPFIIPNYYICQGDTLQPYMHASGGCGTYHYLWSPSTGLSSDTIPNPLIIVGDSIVYSITVTDYNGLTATTQFNSYPRIQANISIDSTCVGCPVSLNTAYSPFAIYHWYLNDTLIQNADSSSIIPVLSGNYFVIVSDLFYPCTSSSDTIYYSVTQIPENINDALISLHPNPSNGLAQLKVGVAMNQHMTVNLCGITGDNSLTLFEGNAKDISLSIDSHKYSAGIYIISITTEKSRRQLRWVVTK